MDINVVIDNLQNNFVNNIVESVESYFKTHNLLMKVVFESYNDEGELCLILYTINGSDRFRLTRCYDGETFMRFCYDDRDEEEFNSLESALYFLTNYLKGGEE